MKCRRCGKPLKAKKSVERGYGAVCFKKQQLEDVDRIQALENEVKTLKLQIHALLANNGSNGHNLPQIPPATPQKKSTVKMVSQEIDFSELQNNPLFLKMKTLSN